MFTLAGMAVQLRRNTQELLREHHTGHPEWYAEGLVASAFQGVLMTTNHRDYDLTCKRWGSVQVKSRVQGTDKTQNRTNYEKYLPGAFDHVAIILFETDYRLKAAVMLPCADVLSLRKAKGHVKFDDARKHPNAVDIQPDLLAVSGERHPVLEEAF